MPGRLPNDFDPAWYAAAYPDVGMSGLDPREHYLRFGSLFDRSYKGSPRPAPRSAEPAPKPEAKKSEPATKPREQPRKAAPPPHPRQPQPERQKGAAIIDRPQGFDPAAAVPKPAARRPNGSKGPFTLDALAGLPTGKDGDTAAIVGPLQAYGRLLHVDFANGTSRFGCAARPFQSGGTRIENAWLAEPSRLRLMISGGADSAGFSFRAYQASPASPAELRMLEPGVQLPPLGPVVHDLELLHPLMPLLLELADAEGATRAFALMPFPSLLPGGVHGAELQALQTEPNPIDDFWACSEALLQEKIGGDGWPQRSVTAILGSDEAPDQRGVREWLATVFGIRDGGPAEQGLKLILPPNSLPTISSLVSRRLSVNGATFSGPYLVAEDASHRPRWSISLPANAASSAVPLLCATGADPVPPAGLAPFPLAITLRPPTAPPSAGSASGSPAAAQRPLSVLVHATNSERVVRLIRTLRSAMNGDLEWLVRVDGFETELSEAVQQACGSGGWSKLTVDAELRELARSARHETLLTISDRVELGDGGAIAAVLDLLQRDERVGSASCALLAEKIIKKEVVLQPASGGLFPTGVSLRSGPRLAFGEPDALQALPDLEYPVVANTLHLTAWRRRALSALPAVRGTGSASTQDLRLGLDLMRGGYLNWCTTRATARLSGAYVPRDAIDPVGPGYLQPQRWEEILTKVTVVRELH